MVEQDTKKISKTRKKALKSCNLKKRLSIITNHAIENRIAIIKADGIELSFHPSAFIQKPEQKEVKPVKPLTDEERLKAEKDKLEADLFYSAE